MRNRFQDNLKLAQQKVLQYPHLVATQRNDNEPRPEAVEIQIKGHMCRIPMAENYILWMFQYAEDADWFRADNYRILMEVIDNVRDQ